MGGSIRADEISDDVGYVGATITSTQSTTQAIDLKAQRLGAVYTPAGIEGTVLSFQGSYDGVAFKDIYDESTEYTVSLGPGRAVAPKFELFYRFRYIKIRAGTSGAPQVQAADRLLYLGTYPR